MTKRLKTRQVGKTEIPPTSAHERKRIEARIKKRHEEMRKKYPEIRGKVVDWISHNIEQESLFVNIRFKDETEFSLRFSPRIELTYLGLSDISTGDFKLIRTYYRQQGL